MEVNIPKNDFNPFKGPRLGAIIMIAGVALAFASFGTLVYTVEADETGVVQRFGKFVRTTDSGLHFKLPYGIETVKKVQVTHVFKEEFGFRTIQAGVRSNYMRDTAASRGRGGQTSQMSVLEQESLMLSGDLNVADVEWIVQYQIKDPVQFLFNVRNPNETLHNMSEAIMRLVVGDRTINEVLTVGREEIANGVETKLQEVLDSYGTGIWVTNVVLQDVTPPDAVKPSFNAVNEARQEKEKAINQAWEDYNHTIPKARGEAEKQIQAAEGYALDRINRAEGDAQKFIQVWEAYKEAKDVTRARLYLETMKELWPSIKTKYIIDDNVKGLLPLLDLSKQEGGATS